MTKQNEVVAPVFRSEFMVQELDSLFPLFVFAYGIVMTVATSLPLLQEKLREGSSVELYQWFYGHRTLGLVCLAVGGLWSLQRLFS